MVFSRHEDNLPSHRGRRLYVHTYIEVYVYVRGTFFFKYSSVMFVRAIMSAVFLFMNIVFGTRKYSER